MTTATGLTERTEEILVALRCKGWGYSSFSPADKCIIAYSPATPDYHVYFYPDVYKVDIWQSFSGGFVLMDIPVHDVSSAVSDTHPGIRRNFEQRQ